MAEKEVGLKIVANAEEATKAFKDVKEQFEKVSEGAEILSKLIEGDFSGALEKATTATKLFGAAAEAAFEPLAILQFIQTVIDAGNALGDFISKTYIYTDADKKADDELKETNKTLLEYANKLKNVTRERELLNATSESAKEKLKLQFAIEDNGSAADVKKKIDELNVEMAKLKKAAQETSSMPIGADMGVAFEAQTLEAAEAEQEYNKLGVTLQVLSSRYKLLSATEAEANDKIAKAQAAEAQAAADAEERARARAAAAYQQAQQKRMQSFQQGLQAKKDAADAFHAVSKADEAAYWADIINLQKPVGENLRQAQHNYVEANKAAQLQSLHDETEAVREKASLAKAGSQDRVNILSAELDKLKQEGKQYTDDYKRLEREREKAIATFPANVGCIICMGLNIYGADGTFLNHISPLSGIGTHTSWDRTALTCPTDCCC